MSLGLGQNICHESPKPGPLGRVGPRLGSSPLSGKALIPQTLGGASGDQRDRDSGVTVGT